jgi:hypothetical protein
MLSDDLTSDRHAAMGEAVPRPVDPRWAELCAKLTNEFPELDGQQIIFEVGRARDATELFGLDEVDRLQSAAAMARNNLTLLSGGADLARLDPERHDRRATETS